MTYYTFTHEINEINFKEENSSGIQYLDKAFRIIKDFSEMKSKESQRKFGKLMENPTLWAYAMLKDKEGKSLKLYPFQHRIINDKHRFVQVVAANQIGKTWTACIKALHHAFYVENASVLLISRSENQAMNILDEIKWMMRRSSFDFGSIKDEVDNRSELHIKGKSGGTSVIRCLPATPSSLGFPATLIICDEMGFWDIENMTQDKFFYQIVETRTNAAKNWKHPFLTMGQIFCISNPNGQQGIYWKLWSYDNRFHKYRYCWLANPENTLEEYNDKKKILPHDIFDSSYAATFTSATGGFITMREIMDAMQDYEFSINTMDSLFLGADFTGEDTHSRNVDSSVLYGMQLISPGTEEAKIKLVFCKEFPPGITKQEIYSEIEHLTKYYHVSLFAYDKVGVGDSVKNDLLERNIFSEDQILSLSYSLPNKSEVYYNLKHLFEQRKIQITNFDYMNTLKEQLMGLKFKRTLAGHLQVHGAKTITEDKFQGDLHDDHADAFANACYAAKLQEISPSAQWI